MLCLTTSTIRHSLKFKMWCVVDLFGNYFFPGTLGTSGRVPNNNLAFVSSSPEACKSLFPPTLGTLTWCLMLNFCLMAWDRSESLIWLLTASNKSNQVHVTLWYSIVGTCNRKIIFILTFSNNLNFFDALPKNCNIYRRATNPLMTLLQILNQCYSSNNGFKSPMWRHFAQNDW